MNYTIWMDGWMDKWMHYWVNAHWMQVPGFSIFRHQNFWRSRTKSCSHTFLMYQRFLILLHLQKESKRETVMHMDTGGDVQTETNRVKPLHWSNHLTPSLSSHRTVCLPPANKQTRTSDVLYTHTHRHTRCTSYAIHLLFLSMLIYCFSKIINLKKKKERKATVISVWLLYSTQTTYRAIQKNKNFLKVWKSHRVQCNVIKLSWILQLRKPDNLLNHIWECLWTNKYS